jgi:MFS family permease
MTSQPGTTPTLSSPLRHRDFRLFWTGLLLSSVGSQFTAVAMAWQIYELTDSPLQIGLIGLARAVPQMAILLFGGLLADAMNRRRLMMLTQASLFGVSGALALLTLAGSATPLRLYVATTSGGMIILLIVAVLRLVFRKFASVESRSILSRRRAFDGGRLVTRKGG